MKIVVLDGYTLNPGDLDWGEVRSLGELTVHDRTPPDLVIERTAGAQAVFTNKVVLDARVLAALPDLRYVGVLATGYNVVDLDAARKRGIVVTNVPDYSTQSVAQLTFALILELCHRAGDHSRLVREGRWSKGPDFTFREGPLVELDRLTLGTVGYGRIGGAVARLGRAFGMEVCAAVRAPRGDEDLQILPLDDLFARSDVVTLHCPLTPETNGMVDARRLGLMKRTAFLVNTARGPLVDESALAEALNSNSIAGAGLDVLSTEPPSPRNPLLSARNCIITPHIAWATAAARKRLMAEVAANLRAFASGHPVNTVA